MTFFTITAFNDRFTYMNFRKFAFGHYKWHFIVTDLYLYLVSISVSFDGLCWEWWRFLPVDWALVLFLTYMVLECALQILRFLFMITNKFLLPTFSNPITPNIWKHNFIFVFRKIFGNILREFEIKFTFT